jgi:hypothetical protein
VTKAAVERKMKFATVLDQGDESEFTIATEEQKQLWLQSFVNQTGSAAEETGEGAGPYADFSAFLPHGGKAHRSQKYRTYIHCIPGPLEQCKACCRVYRAAFMMLDIRTMATCAASRPTSRSSTGCMREHGT